MRVTNDTAPFLEEPEDDELEGFMARGELVERRLETRQEFINTTTLSLQADGPEGLFKRNGALMPIRLSGEDLGWTFASDLGPVPAGLPSRAEVCGALAASTPPAMARSFCDQEGRIILVESDVPNSGPGKRAVVWGHLRHPQKSRVVTVDLDAVIAHKPAVLDARDLGFATRLVLAPLPEGGTWLIFQEQTLQRSAGDGWQLRFLTADPGGRLSMDKTAVPLETHEVKRPFLHHLNLYTRLARTPTGPAVTLEGTEETEEIATGAKKAQRHVKQRITWDGAKRRLVIEDLPVDR